MGDHGDDLWDIAFEDHLAQHQDEWPKDYVPKTWTTNDGQTLLLTEMTTSHIFNCIDWLKRRPFPNTGKVQQMIAAFDAELERRNQEAQSREE